jgi:hypothetical protein
LSKDTFDSYRLRVNWHVPFKARRWTELIALNLFAGLVLGVFGLNCHGLHALPLQFFALCHSSWHNLRRNLGTDLLMSFCIILFSQTTAGLVMRLNWSTGKSIGLVKLKRVYALSWQVVVRGHIVMHLLCKPILRKLSVRIWNKSACHFKRIVSCLPLLRCLLDFVLQVFAPFLTYKYILALNATRTTRKFLTFLSAINLDNFWRLVQVLGTCWRCLITRIMPVRFCLLWYFRFTSKGLDGVVGVDFHIRVLILF